MNVALPQGNAHGWGIAGNHLFEEIARLEPVPDVTLHSMKNPDFSPTFPDQWGKINIGYCFFENDIEAYRHMAKAASEWDYIVAGSSWCEQHLRIGGISKTQTILQGINPECFYFAPPRHDDGRFIVFSGGKFELRKAQDIVIAAMKVMMDRHKDVWLSCAWHNHWPYSIATMKASPFIGFQMDDQCSCDELLLSAMAQNGVDIGRVELHPVADNSVMRAIYVNSDIGLFPNRCEGGNNMVMSEYMACGRTVIASDKTGHADVITEHNAFPLCHYKQQLIEWGGRPSAFWFQPSVEESIEMLEYAYQHRDLITFRAKVAASDLSQLSWRSAAAQFHAVALELSGVARQPTVSDFIVSADGFIKSGRIDLAVCKLQQAIMIAPVDPRLYRALSYSYGKMGECALASGYGMKAEALEQLQRR